MLTTEQNIQALLEKQVSNTLNAVERQQFFDLIIKEPALFARVLHRTSVSEHAPTPILTEEEQVLIEQTVFALGKQPAFTENNLPASPAEYSITLPQASRVHFLRKWGWVAASVLLLLTAGSYWWNIARTKNEQRAIATNKAIDIAPGKDGAVLTLADGTQLILDSLGNGVIASQNGTEILLKNGQLSYGLTGKSSGQRVYNTMSTAKGRQFQVTLPDGTRVWLNSASSIRYPTVFAAKERRVEITGEAYLEVAKNAAVPFLVNANNKAEIEVLGTSFNVNAYDNENSLNTTLLEGSVRAIALPAGAPSMSGQSNGVVLKPGQQAQIHVITRDDGGRNRKADSGMEGIKVINNADIEKVMAWKNGLFSFDNIGLEEAMRQLERWYDIEVVYENEVPDIRLFGEINRGVSLAQLINMLAGAKLKSRIEDGRRLIIMKN